MQRKKKKTRNAILLAARSLVYERGHDKISIQDITDRADVGLGTFYNYFESKQVVFEAVLDEIRIDFNDRLTKRREPIKDPATLVSVTLLFCFHEAQDNEDWRTFLNFSGLSGDYVLQQDEDQCLADIKTGVDRGRFIVDDLHFTCSLIMGMVRHVTLEIMRGNLSRSAMDEATRYILRMLGLPDLVAKALIQTPFPTTAEAKRSNEVVRSAVS